MRLSSALLQFVPSLVREETLTSWVLWEEGGGTEVMAISCIRGLPGLSPGLSQGSFSLRDPLSRVFLLLCLGHQEQGQEES